MLFLQYTNIFYKIVTALLLSIADFLIYRYILLLPPFLQWYFFSITTNLT